MKREKLTIALLQAVSGGRLRACHPLGDGTIREVTMGDKAIGQITTYTGTEHPGITGYKVKIIAILKGGADPDADPDDEGDLELITDDAELARVGGVTARDRVEVIPWIEEHGRFSFVSHDPKAVDLELFAHLRLDG